DFEKAQGWELVQALSGLALPSDQIDTGADRGKGERRGHPQAQQALEPRGRPADVHRGLAHLAPRPRPAGPGGPGTGPEGNVGEGERQQQHPQRALELLADPPRGAVLVQGPAGRGQRSPAVGLGNHGFGGALLEGAVEARMLVPVDTPDLADAERTFRRCIRGAVNPQFQHPPGGPLGLVGLIAVRGWLRGRTRHGSAPHQADRRQSPAELDPPGPGHADLPAPRPCPCAPTKGQPLRLSRYWRRSWAASSTSLWRHSAARYWQAIKPMRWRRGGAPDTQGCLALGAAVGLRAA